MGREWHRSFVLLFFSASAVGQNQRCEVDVPLNIVMPDAALVRKMPQESFVAHQGRNVLAISSVNADSGPRRIVLVVENGKNVNPAARKVEASILGEILAKARAEDSFALLTARGPRKELPFGTSRDVLLSAIGELSSPSKGKNQPTSALEAVLEAASWLQPSQPGDSIIFLTMGLAPSGGDPEYGKVGKKLSAGGIRLFGFQLGTPYSGIYTVGIVPGPFGGVLATIDPNRQTVFELADKTGGFFLEENTEGEPDREYHSTDERLQEVNRFAGQLYKGIVEYYRIRLVAAPEGFVIDLTDSVRQKLLKARMVYPRNIPRCPTP